MPIESQPSRHWTDGVLAGKNGELTSPASAGPAPANPALIPATPFTATEQDNNLTGDGDMTVLTFPDDEPAIALKREGDEFPRLIITSSGDVYLGDGTLDLWNDGMTSIRVADGHLLLVPQDPAKQIRVSHDVRWGTDARGPILNASPSNKFYRLVVDDDGVLSTEEVV